MGGPGSGTWIRVNRKTTVEECYVLDVNRLARDGLLDVGWFGVIPTTIQGGKNTGQYVRGKGHRVRPEAGSGDITKSWHSLN
jgi:hypothetical protein